jgi:DHA1 family inner membrane transport protein
VSTQQITAPRGAGWAELALAVGGFGIGTGEFVIMGLLPNVASTFAVSIPQAGHVISAYALGVVVGGPAIAALGARWPRRRLLVALMLLFAAGNIASALAPGYGSMLLLRFVAGLPHGAYFGVASLVAASLVPASQRARAIGRMMLGLTGATLAGVPLAAWVGQVLGWRAAFLLVAASGALTCVLVMRFVPRISPIAGASAMRELGALKRGQVWLTLAIASIGGGGLFCVLSYIAPTMTQVAHLAPRFMPLVLAVFGVGMIAGNLLGARLADRALMHSIGMLLAWNALVLAAFTIAVHSAWSGTLLVMLVGSGVAIVPGLQIRLMDVAGDAQLLAAALNHSAFNCANALGAWLGGCAISAGLGFAATGWTGSLLALAGLGLFGLSLWLERRTRRVRPAPTALPPRAGAIAHASS